MVPSRLSGQWENAASVALPLLAVLAHAHSSAVVRARVAAGALADLEADAAAGAAGRPGSPGGPGSVPADRRAPFRTQQTQPFGEAAAKLNGTHTRAPKVTESKLRWGLYRKD